MGLHVVDKACQFAEDNTKGTIVVESDIVHDFSLAIGELQSVAARNQALGHAARSGISDPRINGNVGSYYPINQEGLSLEDVKDEQGRPIPPAHPRMRIARYRIDIPVCGPWG